MKTVLITGAAGGIGTHLRQLLKPVYPNLILSDIVAPQELGADEKFVKADLSDLAQVEALLKGVDGIVHMGGRSIEDSWDVILNANIVGTYNLYEAARRQKVQRVVFASSNHAIGFYRRRRRIDTNTPVRPDSRYGVSKAFGEAISAMYADKHGIRTLCIRIGNLDKTVVDKRRMSIWLHPEDLVQLIRIGLEHPDVHHEIVYGASDNERGWWDNQNAFRLGYKPKHRSEDQRDTALAGQAKLKPEPIGDLFQGGPFCAAEFSGDVERIP
jgi:uronate dehydrogenase